MENNLDVVKERIKYLENKKLQMDEEIAKLQTKDKSALMGIRKFIIYENWESKRKIRMGHLRPNDRAFNCAHAIRTNKLLQVFDEFYKLTRTDVDEYHQLFRVDKHYIDQGLEYMNEKLETYKKTIEV